MALTITNLLIGDAVTPHTPGIGAWGLLMAWPAAGYGVVAAGGLGGDEDEQA